MNQEGAGLVEVLVAMIILAIGFLVLIKFQADLSRGVSSVSQQLEAKAIAEDKINELRHFIAIKASTGTPAYENIASGSSSVTKSSTTYTVNWTVTEVSDPPYKVIRVIVSWTDQTNTAQSITIDSIIGEIDPQTSGAVSQGL